MSVLEIEEKALSLSDEEKVGLILKLQESLQSHDEDPPDWHGDVLAERLKKIESGEATFLTLDEFNNQIDHRINEIKHR